MHQNTSKWMIHVLIVIICVFIFMGLLELWLETARKYEEVITLKAYPLIEHTMLSEYRELENNELSLIGLEVLVNEKDATKENLITLVNYLSLINYSPNIEIKIYQDFRAWEEVKSGNHTEILDNGYLAIYVKKVTHTNDNQETNEILWLQKKGHLANLSGTITELQQ